MARSTKPAFPRTRLAAEALEAREVPAVVMSLGGGHLQLTADLLGSAVVVIDHDPTNTPTTGDDFLTVVTTNTHQPQGNWTTVLPKAAVQRITFTGGLGNDTFENRSGIPCVATGGHSNDTLRGGWGKDELRGGMGNDNLYGNNGDDSLFGERGWDSLFGDTPDAGSNFSRSDRGGNDRLEGGDEADYLYGGGGHDALRGGLGRDQLYGELGNDSLYGGADADHLTGGGGFDRYLLNYSIDPTRDTVTGSFPTDVRIHFRNADAYTAEWSDGRMTVFAEGNWAGDNEANIETMDGAFAVLVGHAGSNVLLRKADGSEISFYRQGAVDVEASSWDTIVAFNRPSTGNTYYADGTFDRTEVLARRTIWHELGHNFDTREEVKQILPGKEGITDSFRSLSGWTQTRPADWWNYEKSGDGQWWYRKDAAFARDYGRTNPNEDWATIWEAYFQIVSGDVAGSSVSTDINWKLFAVDALMHFLEENYASETATYPAGYAGRAGA